MERHTVKIIAINSFVYIEPCFTFSFGYLLFVIDMQKIFIEKVAPSPGSISELKTIVIRGKLYWKKL